MKCTYNRAKQLFPHRHTAKVLEAHVNSLINEADMSDSDPVCHILHKSN